MPSNTTYTPKRISDFEANKLNYNGQHAKGTITAGTTASFDVDLSDDHLITGAWLIVEGGTAGDTAALQVVDKTGAFSGVAGTVLNQFINWAVPPTCAEQFEVAYPAKVYAGLTLRLSYTSTGTTDPFVAINFKLHKVLV